MNRQTVLIAAYPKSGSTWLTRLLGDVLDSPTGGCMPSEDAKEVATEGQDRPGPYIVRKGHYVLIDNDIGEVVPTPHRLAWKLLTNEKIVFLIRDPRDICVSGAWHWQQPVSVFLDRMIAGDVARCGRWDEYVGTWTETGQKTPCAYPVRYEDLTGYTLTYMGIICRSLELDFNLYLSRGHQAIERQSFTARASGLSEQELRRNNMRKGIAGDWHNHFTLEMNYKIWKEFGWMMERLGYDTGLSLDQQ